MTPQIEIQLITAVTAAACALVGVFLVLRKASLLSDAIGHAILPGHRGRVLPDREPVVAVAAARGRRYGRADRGNHRGARADPTREARRGHRARLPGALLHRRRADSRYASGVHLDTDAVLLGDPAFSWIERVTLGGRDLGPAALWKMSAVLALIVGFVTLFYKELKLSTFDPALAAALGFAPTVLHYALMSLVSVVAVGAFDVVGSILVVALMIAPPAAAYLLTDRLPVLLGLAAAIGATSAVARLLARPRPRRVHRGRMAVMAGARSRRASRWRPARARGAGASSRAAAGGVRRADAVGPPRPPRAHAGGGP